ncbi:hypothetical protein MSAN_01800100 [Mycena sanguinolenta]|uniref:Uncharacterized protein n=1 Tax=Mycena sanguinolenta TaxID=230812 RepID=A0A8H6XUG0_9AGAR|nr:hypothetical protein MSAN_01800100 [Mycena sanguinolenta]
MLASLTVFPSRLPSTHGFIHPVFSSTSSRHYRHRDNSSSRRSPAQQPILLLLAPLVHASMQATPRAFFLWPQSTPCTSFTAYDLSEPIFLLILIDTARRPSAALAGVSSSSRSLHNRTLTRCACPRYFPFLPSPLFSFSKPFVRLHEEQAGRAGGREMWWFQRPSFVSVPTIRKAFSLRALYHLSHRRTLPVVILKLFMAYPRRFRSSLGGFFSPPARSAPAAAPAWMHPPPVLPTLYDTSPPLSSSDLPPHPLRTDKP